METACTNLSIVIPVYNSERTIPSVIDEIERAIGAESVFRDYEVILVNDGSRDNSLETCKSLCEEHPNVKVVNFSKNFGQHNALMAGLARATGDFVVCLDDDLQTHPSQIQIMYAWLIDHNFDVVYAKYPDKKHSAFRNFGSLINDVMAKWLIDEPKHIKATSFFIARKFVIREVVKYQNPYPYLSGLIFRTTQNIGSVEITHFKRTIGKSNYTLTKLIKLWLNGFTNFSIKPLRIASVSGALFALLSFLLSFILIIRRLMDPNMQIGWTSIMLACFFFGGVQLMSVGLLGEYIGRIYLSINGTPQYVVKEEFGMNKDKTNETDI